MRSGSRCRAARGGAEIVGGDLIVFQQHIVAHGDLADVTRDDREPVHARRRRWRQPAETHFLINAG